VYGFAFKPHTNDTRDSPAIRVCKRLLEEHAHLSITDPRALPNARKDLDGLRGEITFESDPYKAAHDAHAIVLITHWPEFQRLDYKRIFDGMKKPANVFDGRRCLDAAALHAIGFGVYPIGSAPLLHT
jgi:UDPglucose 6-dehydrogenase